MNLGRRSHPTCQRGTITHEATMAIVIATAVIAGTAQILAVIAHQRRDIDRRSAALHEAGNLMEEIAVIPWNNVNEEGLAALRLSDECLGILREPRLRITVDAEPAGVGKHISVEIDWRVGQDQRALPLRLAAWRYPTGAAEQ